MPITSHINKSKDLTIFTATDTLIFDEAMSEIKNFYDGDHPTQYVLWDLSKITENLITLEQMDKIVAFQPIVEREKRESGKTAILLQDGLHWKLARALAKENNRLEAKHSVLVFSSEDAAYKWLDES